MYTPMNPIFIDELKTIADVTKVEEKLGGHHYIATFDNGYGVSIIKHDGSYGRECDKFEIAVLYHQYLCYDTPITSDVIGYLSEDEVMYYAMMIRQLDDECKKWRLADYDN